MWKSYECPLAFEEMSWGGHNDWFLGNVPDSLPDAAHIVADGVGEYDTELQNDKYSEKAVGDVKLEWHGNSNLLKDIANITNYFNIDEQKYADLPFVVYTLDDGISGNSGGGVILADSVTMEQYAYFRVYDTANPTEVCETIPEEYLPDTIARTADVAYINAELDVVKEASDKALKLDEVNELQSRYTVTRPADDAYDSDMTHSVSFGDSDYRNLFVDRITTTHGYVEKALSDSDARLASYSNDTGCTAALLVKHNQDYAHMRLNTTGTQSQICNANGLSQCVVANTANKNTSRVQVDANQAIVKANTSAGLGQIVVNATTSSLTLTPNGTKTLEAVVTADSATITGLDTPVNDTDAANKQYVDDKVTVTSVQGKTGDVTFETEDWTFTLADGTEVTKKVLIG